MANLVDLNFDKSSQVLTAAFCHLDQLPAGACCRIFLEVDTNLCKMFARR